MRISEFEKESILKTAREIFGHNSVVSLFGSRIDDTKLGGDIDIYIEPEKKDWELEDRWNFLVNLKLKIGDQKIDLVLDRNQDSEFLKIIRAKKNILT